jgi:mannose-6-phosphate isomerase-like protein (cupin superfamily)
MGRLSRLTQARRRFMAFTCAIPAKPTVQLDDEATRITRWDFAPGAATGWHRHGHPYFVVMITDGIMRVDNGASVSETVLKAGESYRRPVGVEHDVMNGGEYPMAFVEIELKQG